MDRVSLGAAAAETKQRDVPFSEDLTAPEPNIIMAFQALHP